MSGVQLIRNRRFLGTAAVLYGGVLWLVFQWVYTAEIDLHRWSTSSAKPKLARVLEVYKETKQWPLTRANVEAQARLAQVLQRTGRGKEAVEVLRRLVAARPGSTRLRAQLGLALYQNGQHEEAENSFAVLLGERGGG
jgi:predicted Zn-dependent protease